MKIINQLNALGYELHYDGRLRVRAAFPVPDHIIRVVRTFRRQIISHLSDSPATVTEVQRFFDADIVQIEGNCTNYDAPTYEWFCDDEMYGVDWWIDARHPDAEYLLRERKNPTDLTELARLEEPAPSKPKAKQKPAKKVGREQNDVLPLFDASE